jgi:hypothetical protein
MSLTRAALLLAVAAGCSSGPASDDITPEVFSRIAFLFAHYNAALEHQDPRGLEGVTTELRRLVTAHPTKIAAGLSSPDPSIRADAAFAMGFSKEAGSVAPLILAASDPDVSVRANAIASLGMLGLDTVPTEPFVAALDDSEWKMRVAALFGLRPIVDEGQDRGLLPKIHERTGDPDPNVRNEATILLAKLRRAESVAVLLGKPVHDVNARVRANAALSLGAIGLPAREANAFLIEMLRDEDPGVVERAREALNRINDKDFDRSYATWRDWYEDEQRHFYTCLEHREVSSIMAGECPVCKKKLERLPRDSGRKPEPPPVVFGCPDHPEVLTTSPAKCGKCGKDLMIRRPEAVAYYCPDHPDVVTGTPAKCGRAGCGKDLVLRKPEVISYVCPDHPEVVTTTPGHCGRAGCGKLLVPAPKK